MTASTAHFRPRSDVRFRLLGPEAVVLRQEGAEVMVLNQVGGLTLELLAAGRSLAEATDALAREYAVERGVLAADLAAFVDELLAAQVIEEA
jgi:hypothetical protein